jgi:hypothetical protein
LLPQSFTPAAPAVMMVSLWLQEQHEAARQREQHLQKRAWACAGKASCGVAVFPMLQTTS